ncbi:hypothetical protein TFLX_01075 [Thermoflexales bacterium]|nr:hypothetical protein TFLX_01075 [Thermoflexales bacterium]
MSLEPSAPPEFVPLTSTTVESSPSTARTNKTPVSPVAAQTDPVRKSRRRKFWDAAKTLSLVVSMFVNVILIVAVVILANQVGAIKLTLANVLGQLDSAFEGLGLAVISDTIKISQQVPVQFDLPLNQDTVVTTLGPVPINTQATFSLGQFGSINGTVSLQLPTGTSLPVHLELNVPVSSSIPVVFDQPIAIPLADKGLGPVVAKLRAALSPIIGLVQKMPDRFVIIP